MESKPWLLVDAGGTRTRCALRASDGTTSALRILKNADFGRFESTLAHYLSEVDAQPEGAVIAVAAPDLHGQIQFTNCSWSFTADSLKGRLGVRSLQLVNDFTAVALSLPVLGQSDRVQIGGGRPQARTAMAVLGPGTGLGVSGVLPCADGWAPITGEGGHVTLAASDSAEANLLAALRARFGHVSAERLICGAGLLTLYEALAAERAVPVVATVPEAVARLADSGDPLATDCLEWFFRLLATVAADLALTLGARGGVYLAGGILPQLANRFMHSGFRARFEDKGRYSNYLAGIPTYLIVAAHPALIGLATLVPDHSTGPDGAP